MKPAARSSDSAKPRDASAGGPGGSVAWEQWAARRLRDGLREGRDRQELLLQVLGTACSAQSAAWLEPQESTDDWRVAATWGIASTADAQPWPDWLREATAWAGQAAQDAEPMKRRLRAGGRLLLVPGLRRGDVSAVAALRVEQTDRPLPPELGARIGLVVHLSEAAGLAGAQTAAAERQEALETSLSLLTEVYRGATFRAASTAMVDGVASRWRARRVSLGMRRRHTVHVRAVSHTENVVRKLTQNRAIEAAMEECFDQGAEVLHPAPPDADASSRAAKKLSDDHGPCHVTCLPIAEREGGAPEAVLLLEMDPDRDPSPAAGDALRLSCDLVGPLLVGLDRRDRWLGVKLARGVRAKAAWAVGAKDTWLKLVVLGVLALAAFLCLAKGSYRVSAPFVAQSPSRFVVDAPFDGVIQSVEVEPGDAVRAGASVLASLDVTELRLELLAQRADEASFRREADLAMRGGETAEAQVAYARADQAAAQADLLEHRIAQATLLAPTDGVVVEGDWRQRVGGQVTRGEQLFEVSPLGSLRAELAVPEGRIADVAVGMTGQLAAASNPDRRVGFTVARIEPVAHVKEQQNVFRVWIDLHESPDWLRPGVEGVAKIDVDRRLYAEIWTREAVDWVRMKLWL